MHIIRISGEETPGWREWNRADAVAYELSGPAQQCAVRWLWSRAYPGLAVLSEARYHSAIWAACRAIRNRDEYLRLMELSGGPDARRAGEICWAGGCHPDEVSRRYSLAPAAAAYALGVLAQQEEIFEELTGLLDVPVAYANRPEDCARRLAELAERVPAERVRRGALDLSAGVGRGLRGWASPEAAELVMARAAEQIAGLFP